MIDTNEACDDGNLDAGDGCSADCSSNESCGNGFQDPGEQCDAGDYNSSIPDAPCRVDCVLPTCGDGVKDASELCDTGLANSDEDPDACRPDCTLPRCGDQVVDSDEECDDGGFASGDGCSPHCLLERCGNGFEDPGEACDAGEYNTWVPNAPCRPGCMVRWCGDGSTDVIDDEQCDDGNANSNTTPDVCRMNCTPPRCGDGVMDTGEACDDGNTDALDGCAAGCDRVEYGWSCTADIPNHCTRCAPYFHGPGCHRCAVLVDVNSPASVGDGSTWYTAFRRVQGGIDQAAALVASGAAGECDVWVAEGTYHVFETSETDTVTLQSHVGLYGGFTGVETTRDARDPEAHPTTIDGSDPSTLTKVYHVITAHHTEDATVDGFTITGGHARGEDQDENGAGLWLFESSVYVARSVLTDNRAAGRGGGVYANAEAAGSESRLRIEDSLIWWNTAVYGGGVFSGSVFGNASVTFTNCALVENSVSYDGGGIHSYSWQAISTASVTLTDCTLSGNSALTNGGGIASLALYGAASVSMTGCTLADNSASASGGGVYSYGTNGPVNVTMTDCTLSENSTENAGGGVYSYTSTDEARVTMTRCALAENSASTGGGIFSVATSGTARVTLSGCTLADNSASNNGAGVNSRTTEGTARVSMTGCTLANNSASASGGGVYSLANSGTTTVTMAACALYSNSSDSIFSGGGGVYSYATSGVARVTMTGCTLADNTASNIGGGVFSYAKEATAEASLTTRSSILWGNTPQQIHTSPSGSGAYNEAIHHSNIQGVTPTGTNLSADPVFEDPAAGDYRLKSTSPCIDLGDDSTAPITDIAGNLRVDINGVGTGGTLTDMGAYEHNGVPSNPTTAYEDSLYWPSDSSSNRSDAEDYCARFGGHLVALTDEPENSLVQSLLSGAAWMGAEYGGGWSWATGDTWSWANWAGAVPDGSTGTCATIDPATGHWSAATCSNAMPFVCEQSAL